MMLIAYRTYATVDPSGAIRTSEAYSISNTSSFEKGAVCACTEHTVATLPSQARAHTAPSRVFLLTRPSDLWGRTK